MRKSRLLMQGVNALKPKPKSDPMAVSSTESSSRYASTLPNRQDEELIFELDLDLDGGESGTSSASSYGKNLAYKSPYAVKLVSPPRSAPVAASDMASREPFLYPVPAIHPTQTHHLYSNRPASATTPGMHSKSNVQRDVWDETESQQSHFQKGRTDKMLPPPGLSERGRSSRVSERDDGRGRSMRRQQVSSSVSQSRTRSRSRSWNRRGRPLSPLRDYASP